MKSQLKLSSRSPSPIRLLLAILACFAARLPAATLTWDVAGPTDLWTTTTGNANWTPGPVEWTDGNDAVFNNSTGEAITLSGIVNPTSTAVGANNGSWSFAGSGSIGSGTLTKSGTGTLTISTANTYGGNTTVSAGVLNIQNNTALGNTTGTTSVSSGAALQLQGGITVTGESITSLSGTGVSSSGALLNVSENNEWFGAINANNSSSIGSTAGKLTLSGSLALGTTVSVVGNGDGVVTGTVSGGKLSFADNTGNHGSWTLSGNNSSWSGGIQVGTSNSGGDGGRTVQVTDSTVYGAGNQTITSNAIGTGTITFGSNANSGVNTLQLRANGQNDATAQTLTYGNNLSINGASGVNGTIDVDRQSGTGTNKTLALGTVTTGANGGTLNVTGTNGYSLSVGAVTIGGNNKTAVFNPTTANLTIASVTNTSASTGANTLRLDGSSTGSKVTGVISDGASFATNVRKEGAGTWKLEGNSTYDGTTQVNVGTLLINGDNSAANGAVTVANTATLGGTGFLGGATTVNSGGTVAAGDGGAGTLTFAGGLNLATANSDAIFEAGDLIAVTGGTLSLASAWDLTLSGLGFQNGGSLTLFTYTSPGTIFTNADITFSGLGFTPGTVTLTDTGSAIRLNGLSVVPEPATWLLLAVTGMILAVSRRRYRFGHADTRMG